METFKRTLTKVCPICKEEFTFTIGTVVKERTYCFNKKCKRRANVKMQRDINSRREIIKQKTEELIRQRGLTRQ
ncbi:MAG TPA: hypothetical protein VF941_15500 [Clostridia bacterium]